MITRIGTYSQIKGSSWKLPCLVASTSGNITLSGTTTIDGVSVSEGDRVLVTSQTDATKNGIYIVSSGSTWNRSVDFSLSTDVFSGALTYITSGNTNSGSLFVVSTPNKLPEFVFPDVI